MAQNSKKKSNPMTFGLIIRWLFGLVGCCRWRRTFLKTKWKYLYMILGCYILLVAVSSLSEVHIRLLRPHHRNRKHIIKQSRIVKVKSKTIPPPEEEFFVDNPIQISEDALVPDNVTLTTMSGKELSSLYYRYVNSLQFLCPVKDIFGGILNGIYACRLPKQTTDCHVVFISKKIHGESRMLREMRDFKGCSTKLILKEDLETALRDGHMDIRRTFLKTVDILVIHTDSGEAYLTERLLNRGFLGKVQQLIVKISLTRGATDELELRRRLILLKLLYIEGFRIYHKEPGFRCIYRRWYTYCYTIYMVRRQPVVQPLIIPDHGRLTNMTQELLYHLYHRFAISTQTLCSDIVRVGHIQDGGWNICNDARYRPVTPCIVYSFGISGDWTFDDQISKQWKCKVHSFDPSIGMTDFNRTSKISFHNLGIDDKDRILPNNWQMRTLDSVMNLLGHQQKLIDILKMDVEGTEWRALIQILDSGVLAKVRQLFVEFHAYDTGPNMLYLERLKTFRRLYEQGMRVFWAHPNQVTKFQ